MNEVFSAADLEPSREEKRAARRAVADAIAAGIAMLAVGIWAGGMVALGACAAPFVFRLTPYPDSGNAMGAAFARFDSIAIGCSVVMLACELVRGVSTRFRRPSALARIRRLLAILMAAGAAFIGMRLTPHINELHQAGVRRNVGPEGAELERAHHTAELIGQIEVVLAPVMIGLHLVTLLWRRNEREDEEVEAPLAPGPHVLAGLSRRTPSSLGQGEPSSSPTSGVRARKKALDDEPMLPVEGDAASPASPAPAEKQDDAEG